MEEDVNWLHAKKFDCGHCQMPLEIVDHSPFDGSYYFQCTSCRCRMEVSHYHPMVKEIEDDLALSGTDRDSDNYFYALMQRIEQRLEHCECGDEFHYSASRRCLYCGGIVEGEGHQDIWPIWNEGDSQESFDEGEQLIERWTRKASWEQS
jgi:hypothetical protein